MDRKHWSEVLVVGKGGVNTYHGYPPTRDVKLKAIHYDPVELIDCVIDEGSITEMNEHIVLLWELLYRNNIKYFHFTLEHMRTRSESIAFLYDKLLEVFVRPSSARNIFCLKYVGRR